jgi:nucleoside-diphosphate-sugar epimerase
VEGDSPAPVSAYGRSKLAGELAAARYATRLSVSVVRPPIVFGPGDRGVLEVFRPIAHSGLHVVPGWEERRVSLIHVADLVSLLLLAAEKGERLHPDGAPGQGVYFVAAEHDPTYAELGQAMAKALGKKRAMVVYMPGPLARLVGLCGDALGRVRQRPGWVNSDKMAEALAGSWTCSSAKARRQLGYSPAATLAERLGETAQWYRQAGWL